MKPVFVDSFSIVSALGTGALNNFDNVLKGISGIERHNKADIDPLPFYASLVPDESLDMPESTDFTRYEKLLIRSIAEAAATSQVDPASKDTLFVFSSTKGNIELIGDGRVSTEMLDRMSLTRSAELVAGHFGNKNQPIVVSNACISGVVALLYARRALLAKTCRHVIVAGADTVTRFVYSGFQSFQALSPGTCKPFSASRDGINLGEAGSCIVMTAQPVNDSIEIREGSISNDSNHISGPSRTGKELSHAINTSIRLSGLSASEIDFISAHGTATPYNDEMEAKAFHLSGLATTPVNSLKGYYGHTLGAAGLVESVISMISLRNDVAVPSWGFNGPCVTPGLNVITAPYRKAMRHCLKTASGFGGCNAAIVFSKN